MAFPPNFLDDIRARISVSDVVGRRVKLQRRGREFVGLSPFKTEKTPSFTVNDQKGFYHCFSSGEHGDIFTFLMRTEGLSFPEAVERLADQAGLQMPKITPEQRVQEKRRKSLHGLLERACVFYQQQLRSPAGREALDYLRRRGLSKDVMDHFRLGFAPAEGGGLWKSLQSNGGNMDELVEAGLYRRPGDGRSPYAFFRNRILFPITDLRGRVVAFGGRFMGDAAAVNTGKYINSPDTPLFDKGHTLYNHASARRAVHDGQPLIVTEGYMDVIALARAGYKGAVAPLGTALTPEQLAMLWRMDSAPFLCFDGDEAGRRAASRAADRAIPMLAAGRSLRFVFLPEGQDPDDIIQNGGGIAFKSYLEAMEPLDQFLWRREVESHPLTTPEQRADLERRLFALTESMGDGAVRTHYRQVFRNRLWEMFRAAPPRKTALTDHQRFPKFFQTDSSPFQPAGRALRRQPSVLNIRQQQAVLAALINHPALLPDYLEEIDRLSFAPELDKIWRELQKAASTGETLDTKAVCAHFSDENGERILSAVLNRKVYQLAWQAGPEAAEEEVRVFLDMLLLSRSQGDIAKAVKGLRTPEVEAQLLAMRRSYDDLGRRLGDVGDDAS